MLDGASLNSYVGVAVPKGKPAALAYASAFIDGAIRSGSVCGRSSASASRAPKCCLRGPKGGNGDVMGVAQGTQFEVPRAASC